MEYFLFYDLGANLVHFQDFTFMSFNENIKDIWTYELLFFFWGILTRKSVSISTCCDIYKNTHFSYGISQDTIVGSFLKILVLTERASRSQSIFACTYSLGPFYNPPSSPHTQMPVICYLRQEQTSKCYLLGKWC